MNTEVVSDQNQVEVGQQNELEQKFVRIRKEINEIGGDESDDAIEIADGVLDGKFAEFLLGFQDGAQFNQLKKDVDRLRSGDLSHLSPRAGKGLDQLAKFLDDIGNSERMKKDFDEFMEKIKEPKKLSTMHDREIRRLNLYLGMNENNALDAYKQMKDVFGKFDEKGMKGQDVTYFNEIWNTLKTNYSESDLFITEDYGTIKQVSDLKTFTDKYGDIFPNGKGFGKWDGRNLIDTSLPDISNSIVSKSKVIEKFNALNGTRIEGNKNAVKAVNVVVNDLTKFSKKDGELYYDGEIFTAEKMDELFGDLIKDLAKEGTDFISEEEMASVISECRNDIFNKVKGELLNNDGVAEETDEDETDDEEHNNTIDFSVSKDVIKIKNEELKNKIISLKFCENLDGDEIKFDIGEVKKYLEDLQNKSWTELKSLSGIEQQTWIIAVQIALTCLNSQEGGDYKGVCNVEWLDGIYKEKTENGVGGFQEKFNEGKSEGEKLKVDKKAGPKTIAAIVSELGKLVGDNTVDDGVDADEGELKEPEITWNGNLEGIAAGEENDKKTGKDGLYNGLTREKVDGLKEDEDLNKTIEDIKGQIGEITTLLENDKLSENENLKKTQEGLNLVLTVIDYPTSDNVKALQKFISENLADGSQDKKDFDRLSKKGDNFDGYFGVGTLKGIRVLLNKTGNYINDMKKYLDELVLRDDIKVKEEVQIPKGSAITEASFIDGSLPDGVELAFDPSLDSISTDDVDEHSVTVTVKKDGEEIKTYNVTVKVEEETDDEADEDETDDQTGSHEVATQTTTPPLTLNGHQYLLMGNSGNIADKANLNGATFYYGMCQEPQIEAGEGGQWQTKEVPTDGKDYICYMTLSKHPGKLYEVKVDAYGNLCPIAKQMDLKLSTKDGNYLSTDVLISNNASCKAYLKNKLPDEIKDCDIDWAGSNKDYILKSYGKELTIEPMTIAGEWVCDKSDPNHLSKSLAFINLTNYIRSAGDEYGNQDPDIKFDGGKLWIKGLRTPTIPIGKMEVRGFPGSYGLSGATTEEIMAFKGYNNHEKWRDDWDRKKANRIYKKI